MPNLHRKGNEINMKFEVFQKYTNKVICYTYQESQIDFSSLEQQEAAGYYFKLDGKRISAKEMKKKLNSGNNNDISSTNSNLEPKRKVRSIRCLNNKKEYKNMSEAAKDLNIDSAMISYSLKVKRPTKGYSFEFVD